MRTAVVLLPLAALLVTPLPLALVARCFLPDRRAYLAVALLLACCLTLGVTRLLLPYTADALKATPRGDLAQADSFVVFAFGLGLPVDGTDTAGESNLALARWLLEANPGRQPTVVQDGVYLALRELNAPGWTSGSHRCRVRAACTSTPSAARSRPKWCWR
jgi:hypothetical protein